MNARLSYTRIAGLTLTALGLAGGAHAQVNVLTANYDNERTNANLAETVLNQSNVNTDSFGKVGYFPVDGEIYAQPLYAAGVAIKGQGIRNVVFVATNHNSVYAIDADAPKSTVPFWQVNFGPAVSSSFLGITDILPETGILSTPVIDLARKVMYVVADTFEGGSPVFRMHALSLADGTEMLNGPVVISATVTGNGPGSGSDGKLAFDASLSLQRPGLALANGTVYVAFGSHGDGGFFHGWLLGYDAANLQHQVSVLCTAPNGFGASIWQSGRAPAIDGDGNLYVVTGNGSFDGTANFGESVLKLSGGGLTLLDWFTPDAWNAWNINDVDLGSGGAILIPGSKLLLTAGKSGDIFVIHQDAMGHLGSKNASSVNNTQGTFDLALWNSPGGPIAYVQQFFGALQAFPIQNGQIGPQVLSQTKPSTLSIYAGLAISANGPADPKAIVWQTTGNWERNQQPGTLHALNAANLSQELWNSDLVPDDYMGRFGKFTAPTVANGRVYVPTFSNELVIYGLLAGEPETASAPQVTAVANGASFTQGGVAPGELVAIFGGNLGPARIANLALDSSGHVTTTLAGTRVFFDGVPAPLLYSLSNQVGAVVPFGVSGPNTKVQVEYQGQMSQALTIPVVPAAPALFSQDGSGGDIGAILDQNTTLNSFSAPADKGSIIVLYATGLGQSNPAGEDGKIAGGLPLPGPVLPITVLIDNQPAEIVYAGAAPGMVQGVAQINVRVPQSASDGEVSIVIQAGSSSSPNTVTVVLK